MRLEFFKTEEGFIRSVFIDSTCCVNAINMPGWKVYTLDHTKDCTKKCCLRKWEQQTMSFEKKKTVNIPTRFMFLVDEKQDN